MPAVARLLPAFTLLALALLTACVDLESAPLVRDFGASAAGGTGADALVSGTDRDDPPAPPSGDARSPVTDGGPRADAAPPPPPEDCPALQNCTGRQCGPDPICNVSCGVCREGFTCHDGRCDCVPQCDGRTCGSDGCGGACGFCPDGTFCQQGACAPIPNGCPGLADCGARRCGTDPVCNTPCGDACPNGTQCNAEGVCVCLSQCGDRQCGDDGCGGACGACPVGQVCADGYCEAPPPGCPETRDCTGLSCGPDRACGVLCGRCADRERCQDGACICASDCTNRQCGDDGCGGSCGGCPGGTECQDGQCRCVPQCNGRACGPDGCGGSCGACPGGQNCGADGQCGCDGFACGGNCCDAGLTRCEGARCCQAHWRASLPFDQAGHILADGQGALYLSGHDGDQPAMAALDTCTGALMAYRPIVHPQIMRGARGMGMTVVGNDLLVGGMLGGYPEDQPQGFYARFTRPALDMVFLQPLFGGVGESNVWGLAVDALGRVFMAGSNPVPAFWVIGGDANGNACGWNIGNPGTGKAVTYGDGTIWMTGSLGGQMALVGYDQSCPLAGEPMCICPPVVDARADIPEARYSEGWAVVRIAGETYIAGFATPTDPIGDALGVLVHSFGGESPTVVTRWDPTGFGDGFLGLAIRGNRAYIGGVAGLRDNDPSFDVNPTGHLLVVDLLTGAFIADYPLGRGIARGVALDDTGVSVVLGHDATTEVIRCPLDGPCP
jgi:hypothetical protein